jgi:hypothetical protein
MASINNKSITAKLERVYFFAGVDECRLKKRFEGDVGVKVDLILI